MGLLSWEIIDKKIMNNEIKIFSWFIARTWMNIYAKTGICCPKHRKSVYVKIAIIYLVLIIYL